MTLATSSRANLDEIQGLVTETGRAPRRTSADKLVVPLTSVPPHAAEIETTSTTMVRASVPVADVEDWPEVSRHALERFFDHVNRAVRLVRAAVDGGSAHFEACFGSTPDEHDLSEALAALEATTYFHIREARALENVTLARFFLSNHNITTKGDEKP